MKSQDIVVLLKLVSLYQQEEDQNRHQIHRLPQGDDLFSLRNLETSLGISKSEIGYSIQRSLTSGLAIKDKELNRPKPSRRNLVQFIIHGLKFVFPPKIGAMQRGISTAFSIPTLKDRLISAGSSIYVWPYAGGKEMGQSIEPLFKSVPEAVGRDIRLYEYLALVDAIRLGNQRESRLAEELLSERIMKK